MSQNLSNTTNTKNSETWITLAGKALSKMSPRNLLLFLVLLGSPFLLFFISLKFSGTKGNLNYALGFSSVLVTVGWGYFFLKIVVEDTKEYQNLEKSYKRLEEARGDLLQTMNEQKNNLDKMEEQVNSIIRTIDQDIVNNDEASKLKYELKFLISNIRNQKRKYDTKASRMRQANEIFERKDDFYDEIMQDDEPTN